MLDILTITFSIFTHKCSNYYLGFKFFMYIFFTIQHKIGEIFELTIVIHKTYFPYKIILNIKINK